MGEPAAKRTTADEFMAWDDGTDTRHELIDGQIVTMPLRGGDDAFDSAVLGDRVELDGLYRNTGL